MLFAASVSSKGTRSKLVVSGAPVKHITIHLFHNLLLLLLFFNRLVSCHRCLVTKHGDLVDAAEDEMYLLSCP